MESKWQELCQTGADIIRATTLQADPTQKGILELKDILEQLKELILEAYDQPDLSKVFPVKDTSISPQMILQGYDDTLVVLTTIVHTLEMEPTSVTPSHRTLFASLWSANLPAVLPETSS